MKRLIMFTAAYPYDRMNAWKGQELSVFRELFDSVVVAPLSQKQADVSPDLPEGVSVVPPVFPLNGARRSTIGRAAALVGRRLVKHLRLVEPARGLADRRRYWAAVADLDEILQSAAWTDHVAPLLAESTLYFFWGRGYASVLPYLPPEQQRRSMVRLHRWDLYPHVNDGYIPFQRRIVESAEVVAPISRDGARLLSRLYPGQAEKINCMRLGTELYGLSQPSEDEIFRIVSCAYARPVKRLHLIAEALRLVDFPVSWTQIGDGPELTRLRDLCAALPSTAEVNLMGAVLPEDVPRVYADNGFDLFVNVSVSEGIPVSIMEAMAAGIPALATDVGGNAEIVDEQTGRIVPEDVTAEALAQALSDMRAIGRAGRMEMGAACRSRIERDYDQSTNARNVAKALVALG